MLNIDMKKLTTGFAQLSRARQLILIGSAIAIFSVFAPWHTIGTAVLATDHSYSGLQDQNFIIGALVLLFQSLALLYIGLPVFGVHMPRVPWRMSSFVTFLGGQSVLLVLVLIVMYTTALTRTAYYDLRFGMQMALVASALVFFGGYLMRADERAAGIGHTVDPLTQVPRAAHRHAAAQHDTSAQSNPTIPRRDPASEDDRRMRLDI